MKKRYFLAQFLLFLAFNLFLYLTVIDLTNSHSIFNKLDGKMPVYDGKEEFDPSLSRLTTINDLEQYCDSVFEAAALTNSSFNFENQYPQIASSAVRKKFYHGYSSYGYSHNFMALMLDPLTNKWLSAIVIPDDIMRYPFAACSQQSIVTMELLKRKGFKTRKVGFDGGEQVGGHFCFEAFYDNSWHFFDTDQEPNAELLSVYNRPSIEFLINNKHILNAAYSHWKPERLHAMFTNYFYGKVDQFEAPNALIYQQVTKFLSYTAWVFFLIAFVVVRRKYLHLLTPYNYNVWNRGFFISPLAGERPLSYYSKTRA
jgi:hypothetical protein